MSSLKESATSVEKLPESQMGTIVNGLRFAPGHIYEWLGLYTNDNMPKTLHIGNNLQSDVLITAYIKTASLQLDGDFQWIPVTYDNVKKAIKSWKRRKDLLGNLKEATINAQEQKLFQLFVLPNDDEVYIFPTAKAIQLITKAVEIILPKR